MLLVILALLGGAAAASDSVLTTNTTRTSSAQSRSASNISSSTPNIADYVAEGLGISGSTSAQPANSSSSTAISSAHGSRSNATATAGRVQATGPSSSHAVYTPRNSTDYGNTVTTSITSYTDWCTPYTYSGIVRTDCEQNSTVVMETFTNTTWASATNADACWTEWTSYWSMHPPSTAFVNVTSISKPVTTSTVTYEYTAGTEIVNQTTTVTETSTAPTLVDNGGFTQTFSESISTYTTALTSGFVPTSISTSLAIMTVTPLAQSFYLVNATDDPDWPPPGCTLPNVYPACQSEWDAYATHQAAPYPPPVAVNCPYNLLNMSQTPPPCYTSIESQWASWSSYLGAVTSPICSQASVTGPLCTSLKDAYVEGHNYNLWPNLPEPASFSNGYYSNVAPWFTGWTWPATQAFAPACTLDCGRCAVTGGTIELLYFPPGLSHPATGPVVATTLGTVLTSPTHYISFASLYASDACSGVGTTLGPMILPIPTSEPLSTLFATTRPCDAHLENNAWLGLIDVGTASLNVSDLIQDPVPYDIYTSQLYCASQIAASACDPNACPTTLPYRPIIVLPSELLNTLDPAWATCSLDLRGLYDPPKALQPATAVAGPTTPAAAQATVSATPASAPASVTPAPTSVSAKPIVTQGSTSGGGDTLPAAQPSASADPAADPDSTSPGDGDASPAAQSSASADPAEDPQATGSGGGTSQAAQADPAENSETTGSGGDTPPAANAGSIDPTQTAAQQSQDPQTSAFNALSALSEAQASSGSAGSIQTVGSAGTAASDPSDPSGDSSAPTTVADPAGSPDAPSPTTILVGQPATSSPTTVLVGSQAVTINPGQPIVVAGSTLSPDSAVTVSGHTYSADSAGIVFDGTSTIALSETPAIGSQAVTVTPGQPIIVAGSTLSPDSAVTVSGHTYSAGSAGIVVDGTSTISLLTNEPGPLALLTLGSQVYTASAETFGSSTEVVVDGVTIKSDGPAATIAGSAIVSLESAGLVVGGTQTIGLSATGSNDPEASHAEAVLTLGSATITAYLVSGTGHAVVVDGITLSPGGSDATVDGTEISAGTAGVVVGGTQTANFDATSATDRPSENTSGPGSSASATSPNVSTAQSAGRRNLSSRCWVGLAVMGLSMLFLD